MIRHFSICTCLALVTAAIPSRAANRPHAGTERQSKMVWTNDDLDKLHDLDLISIVGPDDYERPAPVLVPRAYLKTQDPEWYAEEAVRLRDELERRQAQLGRYSQALEEARSLETMTGGVNLNGGDIGITPEAGIEILQQRLSETQRELDALEDLARRHDIPPATLRGQ